MDTRVGYIVRTAATVGCGVYCVVGSAVAATHRSGMWYSGAFEVEGSGMGGICI